MCAHTQKEREEWISLLLTFSGIINMEPRGYSRDFGLESEKDGESEKGFQACTTLLTSLVLDTRHREVGLEVGRPARGGLVQ